MSKRLVSSEQMAFINLQAAVNMAKVQEEKLARRIDMIPGAKRYLRSGIGMLNKLVHETNATLPIEQLDHLDRQKGYTKFTIGVKAQLPRDPDREFGRHLSFKELDIVATAIRECCRICTTDDPQQQKQCPFCKLLEVLPTDKPDENARGCGYFEMW